ncbi:MAG: hypothetical protein ACPGEG_10625 [Salibacteraceae bacterium]
MVKKISLLALGAVLFLLGFIREYSFESINKRLGALSNDQWQYELSSFLSILNSLEYPALYKIKFVLILVFALLFLAVTLVMIMVLFNKTIYLKYTILFFVTIFILSFVLYGLGYVLGNIHKGYTMSRYLIEFIESPLATFFIIPALFLIEKQNRSPKV